MRGVKCSWKEMHRLHTQVLPAIADGDCSKYADLRCVNKATVTQWRRASEAMTVMDDAGLKYFNFQKCGPSHAMIIATAFQKRETPPWSEATKQQILDWVDKCECEGLTVEELRMQLQQENEADVAAAETIGLQTSLLPLIECGAKFRTVYADPPWQYSNKATRSNVDSEYKATMSLDEICAEPVSQLVTDNAHLHLWTTNAFLFDAKRVMEAWGFEYKSCFVWVKPQMGIGNYWRVSHEFMLLGVRGSLRFKSRGEMSWAQIDRTKHSRKPREVRELVEKVSPGPYLEMYGREHIGAPWTVYGNEPDPSRPLCEQTS